MNKVQRKTAGVFFITILFSLFVLTVMFSANTAHAAITVTLKQVQNNPVYLGNTVSYSLTVSDDDDNDFASNIFIEILSNSDISNVLVPEGCQPEGDLYCDDIIPDGATRTFTFEWVPPSVGSHMLSFRLSCFDDTGTAVARVNQAFSDCQQSSVSLSITTLVTDDFSELPGLTNNERQIASSFNSACAALNPDKVTGGGQGKLLTVCQSLQTADSSTVLIALQQLTPTQAPAQGRSSIEASNKQSGNINARMSALRRGFTGTSVSGLQINFQGMSLPVSIFSTMFENKFDGNSDSPEGSALYGRLGVFVNGNISIGDRDTTSNEAGFDFSTEGITVGADYRLSRTVVAGVALGYVDSKTEYGLARGRMDVQGYSFSFFGSFYRDSKTYWDVIASIGKNSFDSQRNIQFGTISEQALGNTDGFEFSLGLGGGYDYNQDSFTFGPYGRINLIHADIDAYAENSSSGFELDYGQQSVTSLTTTLGAQANLAVSTTYGILSPQLRFEWVREFEDESRYITASFVNDPSASAFKINTDASDKNFWNVGLGATATFSAGRSAFFYIDSVVGKDYTTQNTYSAGFRMDY